MRLTAESAWEGQILMLDSGRTVRLDEVGAVWWRGFRPRPAPANVSNEEAEFVRSEFHHALGSVWEAMKCGWMNHPTSVQLASYKFEQLARAREFEFATPDTVVTNSIEIARQFADQRGGECIYKVLTASTMAMAARPVGNASYSRGFACPTTTVSSRDLSARSSLGSAPCQFQELLDKGREFRVIVLGEELFAVSLEPPEPGAAGPDWRALWTRESTAVVTLPTVVSEACQAITASYGLTFAAIDLVETRGGELYFLELNPLGQYLYLEDLHPALRLCDATIDVLVGSAT